MNEKLPLGTETNHLSRVPSGWVIMAPTQVEEPLVFLNHEGCVPGTELPFGGVCDLSVGWVGEMSLLKRDGLPQCPRHGGRAEIWLEGGFIE